MKLTAAVATQLARGVGGLKYQQRRVVSRALMMSRSSLSQNGDIRRTDVAIIGGGLSGLTAARRLREAGLSVVILEQGRRLGGIWSGSGTYECLQLQQRKSVFKFDGLEWPAGTPEFPRPLDVKLQLERFVEAHGLSEVATLGARATGCAFRDADQERGVWTTRYETDEGEFAVESRYVAVACGSLGPAAVPGALREALTEFRGRVDHSTEYYRPVGYQNQDAVVIGWGASSVEIAADLAQRGECASVTLVAPPKRDPETGLRYDDWCLSRDLDHKALDQLCADPANPELGMDTRNEVVRDAMLKRHPKALEALPAALRPRGGPLDGRIIVSEAFNDAVADGRIQVVAADIVGAESDAILVRPVTENMADSSFSSSSEEARPVLRLPASALVLCTGYAPPLPRVAELMDPAPEALELYDTIFAPDCPQAAFLGLGFGFISIALLADVQARVLAGVASGAASLPTADEMRQSIADIRASNLMGTTQCLTENAYFHAVAAKALGADALSPASESTPTAPLLSAPPPPRAAKKAKITPAQRQLGGTRGLSSLTEDHPPSMSAVGEAINSSRFESADPSKCYSAWAETYDDDSFGVLKFDSPFATRDYVAAYWPSTRARVTRVLDVGCGTGAVARLVKEKLPAAFSNSDWHGIDLTPEMLAVARKCGDYNTLFEWSITNTPWPVPDDAFDLAPCNGVLVYVEPSRDVLAEFCRVVKPGGHAVLMIRDDNFPQWQTHLDALERQGAWRLVEVSESRDNFPGYDYDQPITYRIYVLRILERAPAL